MASRLWPRHWLSGYLPFRALRTRSLDGFTLIELLVVITVIVTLLAMLAPALDQAVYQAELAVCAAQLGGMGRGVLTYAASYKRHYPARPGVVSNDDQFQPHDLCN